MWLIKCLGLSKKNTLKKKRNTTSPENPGEELSQASGLTPNETPNGTAKKCRSLKIIIALYSIFFLAEVSSKPLRVVFETNRSSIKGWNNLC